MLLLQDIISVMLQFSNSLDTHWTAVKRIPRQLKGTLSHGFHIQPAYVSQPFSSTALCDAYWASYIDDRKSGSGSAIFLGPNLVSWWSRKRVIARSSTEVESHSLAQSLEEIIWIQALQKNYIFLLPPVILCDNKSVVAIAQNPIFHS